MLLAFGRDGEVHHHDPVLLDDADQENDSDEGDQGEVGTEDLQREQGAQTRRGQRRDDRQRMREALVEHTEHDIDREQRRDDQERLRTDRLPIGAGIALEFSMQCFGDVQCRDGLIDRACRLVDGDVLGEAEADRGRGVLTLVVDHQRLQAAPDRGHRR